MRYTYRTSKKVADKVADKVDTGGGAFPVEESTQTSNLPSAIAESTSSSSIDSEAFTSGSGNPFRDCLASIRPKGVNPGEDNWLANAVEQRRVEETPFSVQVQRTVVDGVAFSMKVFE